MKERSRELSSEGYFGLFLIKKGTRKVASNHSIWSDVLNRKTFGELKSSFENFSLKTEENSRTFLKFSRSKILNVNLFKI